MVRLHGRKLPAIAWPGRRQHAQLCAALTPFLRSFLALQAREGRQPGRCSSYYLRIASVTVWLGAQRGRCGAGVLRQVRMPAFISSSSICEQPCSFISKSAPAGWFSSDFPISRVRSACLCDFENLYIDRNLVLCFIPAAFRTVGLTTIHCWPRGRARRVTHPADLSLLARAQSSP